MPTRKTRVAEVSQRRKMFFVQSYDCTVDGIYVANRFVEALDSAVSDEALGGSLLEALRHSKDGVPPPADWALVIKPILSAAGVRSWSAFVSGTKSCNVEETGGVLAIVPMKNAGPRGGFLFLDEQRVELPLEEPAERIGAVLRQRFEFAV